MYRLNLNEIVTTDFDSNSHPNQNLKKAIVQSFKSDLSKRIYLFPFWRHMDLIKTYFNQIGLIRFPARFGVHISVNLMIFRKISCIQNNIVPHQLVGRSILGKK